MKKIVFLITLLCLFCSHPLNTLANDTISPIISTNSDASTFSDIVKWRYKTINGKLYKRLYNYSKGTWVGDWILVL